jgi:glycosyltransferase involved in cell wall biosynthesis
MMAIGPAADPELAAVVLSYRDQSGLVDAVRSLLAQDQPLEIIVVNSGGGTPEATLRDAGVEVRVSDRAERLLVGAARNLGIDATRAPYIAFLAADCVAQPGWARGRLREHRAGAWAVSAAIINPAEDNLAAWAAHIIDGARRMPGTPAEHRIDYGVSYERSLFGRFGRFREDLPVKEDTEFNTRLVPLVPIRWAPDVRAAHRYPVTTQGLVRDQFARGRRDAQVIRRMDGRARNRKVATGCLVRTRAHIQIALMSAQPHSVPTMRRAIPLALFAGAVRGLGALSA